MSEISTPLRIGRPGPGIVSFTLARPRGNVLDATMIAALDAAFAEHGADRTVRAILLGAEGPSFSYGASVQEHRREEAPAMLRGIHGLFRRILELGVPVVASVRGSCLGGGLELVLCASFVVAAPDAMLGQPEIRLGVFAPFASVMLPIKVGLARAERILLSGEPVDARAAQEIGLVDVVAGDPDAAALALAERLLADKSGAALRHALRAARLLPRQQVDAALGAVERLYLDELMATADANEGIEAFLAKRAPRWEDR